MDLSQLLLKYLPFAILCGVGYFVWTSNRRQRIAVLLTWLLPGAGHWWLGHRARAKFVAACIIPMFFAGLVLAEFLNVSPLDRHTVWGIAQIPGGLLTVLTWLGTMSLKVTEPNDLYLVGSLYTGSACLLNLIAMCDVWDLSEHAAEESVPSQNAPAAPSVEEPA